MSRAVYEDDVIKLLNRGWKSGVYPLARDVRALPSAQSEIIYCKDCIWHNTDINQCGRQVCSVMYADDFCNYGERRGEQDG